MHRFLLTLLVACGVSLQAQVADNRILGDLTPRNLGPSLMSGRISCIEGVSSNAQILYAGTAGGGVWKSNDHGVTFKPIFDKHCQSIGALCIDPSNPSNIWVGSGESWVRNSVIAGDGIYKSEDAGETWKKTGLPNSHHISRIVVHPKNSKVIYVAVLGALSKDSEERGVYKSEDGGATWNKVLYLHPSTGCADLAMDPSDPEVLYAAMWEFRRKPWSFVSGGVNSAIYKSADGGKTWNKTMNGIVGKAFGRIAIAVSPADPNLVYASIESEKSALYVSSNKGQSWQKKGTHTYLIERPFYFARLVADPKNPQRIYRGGMSAIVSNDGGESFSPLRGNAHSDHHDVWINPSNTDNLVLATDGGVFTSFNRGGTFTFCQTLPVGQFYHVEVDKEEDYMIYGGLQDNGSWMGNSRTNTDGISNRHWTTVGWGDGFWVLPDPSNNDYVYSEAQGGELMRYYKKSKTSKSIKPVQEPGTTKYRYNWNTPIAVSPTLGNRLYYAAQFLFVSNDRGDTWTTLSPDLTTNNPQKQQQGNSGGLTYDNSSAENHCTIFCIAESPLNTNLLYVGTDDGNLQISKDFGKSWKNLSPAVTGIPAGCWVSSIEPSRHAEGRIYATFEDHLNGDFSGYAFVSEDYGTTWKRLGEKSFTAFLHVLREDPVNPEILYAGAENGLYISFNRGVDFIRLDHTNAMPNAPVRDIRVAPQHHDLVVATHGRGIFVLDDIRPLRKLPGLLTKANWHFFKPDDYYYPEAGMDVIGFSDNDFSAPNPKSDFLITYFLPARHSGGDFNIEVCDTNGNVLQKQVAGRRKGLNQTSVNLNLKPPAIAPSPVNAWAGFVPMPLREGKYLIRLVKDTDTLTHFVKLFVNPQSIHTPLDKQRRHDAIAEAYALNNTFTYSITSCTAIRKRAEDLLKQKGVNTASLNELIAALSAVEAKYVDHREGMISSGNDYLRDQLSSLYLELVSYAGAPSSTQTRNIEGYKKMVEQVEQEVQAILKKQLPKANKGLPAGTAPIERPVKT